MVFEAVETWQTQETYPVTSDGGQGFVYVATGEEFVSEAIHSAQSLKRWIPDARICLITGQTFSHDVFEQTITTDRWNLHPYQFKLNMGLAPYERVVFLDSDTEILDDVSRLFTLLDEFDLALLPDRYAQQVAPYDPDIGHRLIPEWNTGVIAFRRNADVLQFLADCAEDYAILYRDAGFMRGQRSFLRTLYRSRLRIAEIPNRYNFMPYEVSLLLDSVKILHGRVDKFERRLLEKDVLHGGTPRAFIPHLGAVVNRGRYDRGIRRQRFLWHIAYKALRSSGYWLVHGDLRQGATDVISQIRIRGGRLLRLLGLRGS